MVSEGFALVRAGGATHPLNPDTDEGADVDGVAFSGSAESKYDAFAGAAARRYAFFCCCVDALWFTASAARCASACTIGSARESRTPIAAYASSPFFEATFE